MVFDFLQLLIKQHVALFRRVHRGVILLERGNHMREQCLYQMVHEVL